MSSSNDDPLAAALRRAKGLPRSRPQSSQFNQPATSNDCDRRRRQGNGRSRSKSPTSTNRLNNPSICSFCESEAAAICISKSLTKTKIPLCLVHYYTTRSCRMDPQKVSIINKDEVSTQLSYVQDLFSEAFTELQKEISMEAAKSFESMVERGSDPLSILNDPRRKTIARPRPSNKKSTKDGNVNDGGFMKRVHSKEIELLEQQKKRISLSNGIGPVPVSGPDGLDDDGRSEGNDRRTRISRAKPKESNPYKRRKISAKSSWNLVLNGNLKENLREAEDDNQNSNKKTDFFGVTCTCGGVGSVFGNTTSRNNDVPKAETWGTKRDNEIMTRYQCQSCGKIWNEEE